MTALARLPWRWVLGLVPAVIALLALSVRDVLWRTVMLPSRVGETRGVPGYIALVAIALLTLFYAATFAPNARNLMASSHVPNTSETELGCALVLTRGLLLAALYGLALRLWFWMPN
jgi:hypothetical protein